MWRVWFASFCLVATIVLFSTAPAPVYGQKADRPVRMQISGSVKEIAGLQYKVVTEKDEIWILGFSPNIVKNEDIKITGEADLAWLQTGMTVRMSARINTKKGTFLDPVTDFEVIAMRPGIEFGIQNENEPKPTDGLFEAKAQSKKSPKLPEEMTATIVGRLGSTKQGKISINVPGFNKTLKGDLSEKCKVLVDIDDPTMIRVGDKVTIEGSHYEYQAPSGGTPGIGAIEKLEVQANSKFEVVKQPKRGAKPYDNTKTGDPTKDGKPDEKGGAKAEPAKGEKGVKPTEEPKKKP